MIILKQGGTVGTLHPDGSIESQLPELRDLNEFWQTKGIFSYGGPGSHETEDGAIAEGAAIHWPSAETIDMVVFELRDRGYEVVAKGINMSTESLPLTHRFTRAIDYARPLDVEPYERTGSPYMAHLLGVASLVMGEFGRISFEITEDVVIAALLHHAAEDHGGLARMQDIRHNFGPEVGNIVDYLTDYSSYDSGVGKPWIDRKKAYLNQLRHGRPESQLIVAASELHTAREILEGCPIKGSQSWWRFNCRREDHLWYYTQLLEVFDSLERNRIVDELHKVVAELKQISERDRDTHIDGNPSDPSTREVILEAGVEGGSLSIFRTRNTQGIWEYWAQRDETTMADLLPDEKFSKEQLFERTGGKSTFEDALYVLDRYPWFSFYPVEVHPDFAASILREVVRRGGEKAAREWQRGLRR